MAPTRASQPLRRRFRRGDGQFSPEKIPVVERDDELDGGMTRFYISTVCKSWAAPNGHCCRWQLDESGHRRGEFSCLVGIACTITVERTLCRTIPESYGENKVSFLALVGIACTVRIPWVSKGTKSSWRRQVKYETSKMYAWNPYVRAQAMVYGLWFYFGQNRLPLRVRIPCMIFQVL
jgi:hypothetical protein